MNEQELIQEAAIECYAIGDTYYSERALPKLRDRLAALIKAIRALDKQSQQPTPATAPNG